MPITKRPTRLPTHRLTRAITQAGAGGWTPALWFLANEQGIWLDPSDFSTMFQDSAGTTPVTAVGQSVGRILDKSGRGNHATQADAAKKPLLQQDGNGKYYLAFDGVDDSLSTGSIDFTSTDKMTVVAGVQRASVAANQMVWEYGDTGTLNGSFDLFMSSGSLFVDMRSTAGGGATFGAVAGVGTSVYTEQFDLAQTARDSQIILRDNGGVRAATGGSAAPASGTFGNHPLYIGRRGGASLPFNGHLYQLIVRGAATAAAGITDGEAFTAGKAGVTL